MKLNIIDGQYTISGTRSTINGTPVVLITMQLTGEEFIQTGSIEATDLNAFASAIEEGTEARFGFYDGTDHEKYQADTEAGTEGFTLMLSKDGYGKWYRIGAQDRARIAQALRALA